MLLVLNCVTPSVASAAISNRAEALLPLAFHHSYVLNHSVKSWTDSPATPIATAPSATYPAASHHDSDETDAAISRAMVAFPQAAGDSLVEEDAPFAGSGDPYQVVRREVWISNG